MNKHELQNLLQNLGIRPSRRLGQHFLVDRNLLDAMLRDAAPRPDEPVLEVGAGPGMLTKRLLEAGARVTAVEIDVRFVRFLRETFSDFPNFRLLHADACRVDYDMLFPGGDWRSISNLPYAVTGPLLARLAALGNVPVRMHLLLQREAAERLLARPHTGEYGPLTVSCSLCWNGRILREVPPDVFYPRPAVRSMWVVFERRADIPSPPERAAARTVARAAFSQRRKQAQKLLADRFGREAVAEAFDLLGIDSRVRPEAIPPATYLELARLLLPAGSGI